MIFVRSPTLGTHAIRAADTGHNRTPTTTKDCFAVVGAGGIYRSIDSSLSTNHRTRHIKSKSILLSALRFRCLHHLTIRIPIGDWGMSLPRPNPNGFLASEYGIQRSIHFGNHLVRTIKLSFECPTTWKRQHAAMSRCSFQVRFLE
jgi:hypothetical protein